MRQRNWSIATGLALVMLAVGGWANAARAEQASKEDAARPNVVLISLDTVRPDHLGSYGYDRETSPNLDRLAEQGVRFEKVWAQAPWTLPSHMSVFTSKLPSQHGVDSMGRVLPKGTTTLAQLLQDANYHTAAIVNNGHMRAHWGFDRGFDLWNEFQVDTPQGACPNISAQALGYLQSAADDDKPFFLFLHYYDAHDAYDPPAAFREKFGSKLTGMQARQLTWAARPIDSTIEDPAVMAEIKGSYDGEIAWMDHELGKVIDVLPANTLVIVFSDHGEAFEEHGMTLHGGALYEEETRVPLIMRLPDGRHAGKVVDQPTMLMDIAPTILAACGVDAPADFEGLDLAPLAQGKALPTRLIVSENKAVLESQFQRSVVAYPWKLVHGVMDGSNELYRLPDETQDLADVEPSAVEAMKKHVAGTMKNEDYWMVHARGSGKHEVTISASEGRIALFIPSTFDPRRDMLESKNDGKTLRWVTYGSEQVKSMYVELAHPGASLIVDVTKEGKPLDATVTIGANAKRAGALPVRVAADFDRAPVMVEQAMKLEEDGVAIIHHVEDEAKPRVDNTKELEAEAIEQLRALGYIN